jgi:hypothetical protein
MATRIDEAKTKLEQALTEATGAFGSCIEGNRMKTVSMPEAGILWAKDRALDDLEMALSDFMDGANFASSDSERRRKITTSVARIGMLLLLSDDQEHSLQMLQQANYWNGEKDSFWEAHAPPEGYYPAKA